MRFYLSITLLFWINSACAQEREPIQYPYDCLHRSVTSLIGTVDFPLQCITAEFAYRDFDNLANFSNAVFHSTSNFTGAQFSAAARFGLASFDSLATFNEARFSQEANFLGVNFSDNVSFTSAAFKDFTIFLRTDFAGQAMFDSAEFDDYTSFEEAIFSSIADFNNASLRGRTSFERTILPDTLDLRSLRTELPINLTLTQLDTLKAKDPEYRSLIALEDADISQISINMELFRLWFPGLENQTEKKTTIYQAVLKKLEEDGLSNSYEVLDIEYRSFVNTANGRYAAHFINKYGWNYGYNKEWITWWVVGCLGLLVLVYSVRSALAHIV